MKKIFALLLVLSVMLGAYMFNGCNNNNSSSNDSSAVSGGFTRSDAAEIIVEKTGFTGGKNLTVDVKKADKNRKFFNSNLECHYYQYLGARPPKKQRDENQD